MFKIIKVEDLRDDDPELLEEFASLEEVREWLGYNLGKAFTHLYETVVEEHDEDGRCWYHPMTLEIEFTERQPSEPIEIEPIEEDDDE
jgi:hypothetical protein